MIDKLKKITSELIEKYIDILEQNGDPNEAYKYLAINTFQKNWNLEADDFYQMFRASFSKVSNLLYQNSWGFIEKLAKNFPEETKIMFRNLYDESVEITQRIITFQSESEKLLQKLRQVLSRTNINAQQDERTISVYLAFRFPEKYTLYKADYYEKFCEKLNVKSKKSGERFLHLQELSEQIIKENLLDDNFINTYRKFYQKPDWDDKYLMIQNVLFVVFRDLKDFNLLDMSKKYWLYAPGENAYKWDEFHELGIMALGWDELGDIRQFNSRQEIKEALVEAYGGKGSKKNDVSANYDFVHTINIGDIIIAKKGRGELLGFGEVTSNYIYDEKRSDYNSIRKVDWKLKGNWKVDFSLVLKTLTDITSYSSDENKYDTYYEELLGIMTTKNSITLNALVINFPLNQILFGAPGTGKTYNTKKIAVEIINGEKARTREEINAEYENLVTKKQIVFTTFHQSLSYEDFIEGIKPETSDGNVTYDVKDGIFKILCQNANPKNTISFENAYEKLQQKLAENEIIELKTPTNKTFSVALNKNGNLSLMTGSKREKQGVLTKEKLLQQLNGKEVFIGWEGYFKGVINHLQSEFNFNPETTENTKNYVLIIDEINRGNVSAIFGELITLLEEDKRKGNKEQIEVTLPYSADKFSVPNNVYIIGTMNTADRSVEALDTALRRRFSFVEMQPNPEILLDSEYQDVNLKHLLETINQRIEVLIDKDHQIGHSYFIGIQNLDDLKLVFKDKIIPLLEEYFYGDFGKIGLVLGGNFISQEGNTAKFPKNFTYENDFLEDKKVYRFTPFESWNESTFISVYED